MAELDLAAGRRFQATEQADQRGFARAVGSHQGDAVAAVDLEADIPEDVVHSGRSAIDGRHRVVLRQMRNIDDRASGGGRLRNGEVDGRLLLRHLDALDLVQLLDARLHLLGLGGLVAEAVDEGLQSVDAVALVFVRAHQLRAPLFFLHQVLFVVAVIGVQPLVPYLDGLVHGDIEKVAVVGDEDEGVGIIVQVVLQPVAALQVEVVGGLVEQQQRGLLQQQLGQGDAHLPAAGKFLRAALPVLLGESEPAEHGADLRVEGVDVMDMQVVRDVGVAVGGGAVLSRFGVGGGESVGDLFGLALQIEEVVEDGEALGKDGLAADGEAVLRQVSNGHSLDRGELAVVEGIEAGEDLEQRGFARAIAANQASALVRRDEPVDVFKEEFGAEPFAGGGELKHCLLFSHLRRTKEDGPHDAQHKGERFHSGYSRRK